MKALSTGSFGGLTNGRESEDICSVPRHTFMGVLSDRNGNCLQIVPGQGCRYHEKPEYLVTTIFSPFKMDSETHPWMGWDRYQKVCKMMSESKDDFDVSDCFTVLRAVSQTVCPMVVSIVFDVTGGVVFWFENRQWDDVKSRKISAEITIGVSGDGSL